MNLIFKIMNEFEHITVRAKINGEIMKIDFCDTERDAYQDMGDKIEYLGRGKYYSYNDSRAKDKNLYHFWK